MITILTTVDSNHSVFLDVARSVWHICMPLTQLKSMSVPASTLLYRDGGDHVDIELRPLSWPDHCLLLLSPHTVSSTLIDNRQVVMSCQIVGIDFLDR
jgi:hypothetical protein